MDHGFLVARSSYLFDHRQLFGHLSWQVKGGGHIRKSGRGWWGPLTHTVPSHLRVSYAWLAYELRVTYVYELPEWNCYSLIFCLIITYRLLSPGSMVKPIRLNTDLVLSEPPLLFSSDSSSSSASPPPQLQHLNIKLSRLGNFFF